MVFSVVASASLLVPIAGFAANKSDAIHNIEPSNICLFTQDLNLGSSGPAVSFLQTLLKGNSDLFPSGTVTGYFGQLTQGALNKFFSRIGKRGQPSGISRGDLATLFPCFGITVLAPNGGEIWKQGETHIIQWNFTWNTPEGPTANTPAFVQATGGAKVVIELMKTVTVPITEKNGTIKGFQIREVVAATLGTVNANVGQWSWLIAGTVPSGEYKIRVRPDFLHFAGAQQLLAGGPEGDESNGAFIVGEAFGAISYFLGPDSAQSGIPVNFSWDTINADSVTLNIACVSGISQIIGGNPINCGTGISVSASSSGYPVVFRNDTGLDRSVTLTLTAVGRGVTTTRTVSVLVLSGTTAVGQIQVLQGQVGSIQTLLETVNGNVNNLSTALRSGIASLQRALTTLQNTVATSTQLQNAVSTIQGVITNLQNSVATASALNDAVGTITGSITNLQNVVATQSLLQSAVNSLALSISNVQTQVGALQQILNVRVGATTTPPTP